MGNGCSASNRDHQFGDVDNIDAGQLRDDAITPLKNSTQDREHNGKQLQKKNIDPLELQNAIEYRVHELKRQYSSNVLDGRNILTAMIRFNQNKIGKHGQTSVQTTSLEDQIKHLKELRSRKSELLLRLSEKASTKLRANNPDIADLSDPNRATKLSEKLSELYDNEWTDAFENINKVHKKRSDKEIAIVLREILKHAYDQCEEASDGQRRKLFHILHMKLDLQFSSCSPDLYLKLKEFQKMVSPTSIESMTQHVESVCTEEKLGDVQLQKKDTQSSPFKRFLRVCTEISWYTQIQDPPLVLQFDASSLENPQSKFRAYTVAGPELDYVLWPIMLLHEGGPMVAKGIAQFKKESGKTAKESTCENDKSDRHGKGYTRENDNQIDDTHFDNDNKQKTKKKDSNRQFIEK